MGADMGDVLVVAMSVAGGASVWGAPVWGGPEPRTVEAGVAGGVGIAGEAGVSDEGTTGVLAVCRSFNRPGEMELGEAMGEGGRSPNESHSGLAAYVLLHSSSVARRELNGE
jgi:hypothetical protein